MNPESARSELITLLQMAYSGERAAAYAYLGHRRSLRKARDAADSEMLRTVLIDEIRHRRILRRLLAQLGASGDPRREIKMRRIGLTIGAFCRVGGWYGPMYGAGRLERGNIAEYEVAARLAFLAECGEMCDQLLELAEVEWDHEAWFRRRAESHWLWRVSPHWPIPDARDQIQSSFERFVAIGGPAPTLRWTPLR